LEDGPSAGNELSFDTVSMTSSYVGKSKLIRARSQGHTRRGGRAAYYNEAANPEVSTSSSIAQSETPQHSKSNMKMFIPKEYFKHAGYIIKKSETASSTTTSIDQRQQPRRPQIPFKERFNEKLEYPASSTQ